jgi:tetratricopeptide (TPR) repeat protein
MEKKVLAKHLTHPGLLNSQTLNDLLEVRTKYPYFQTSHLLVVKNKFDLGIEEWQNELESVSAYVTDRRVLYDLIYPLEPFIEEPEVEIVSEDSNPGVNETPSDKSQTDTPVRDIETAHESVSAPTLRGNISNLLSWQLEELELMDPDEAELVPEIGIDINKSYGDQISTTEEPDLLTIETENENSSESSDSKTEHKELIEKFIVSNPRLQPRVDNKPAIDISEDSVKEHDGIFTDTLAKIYIKQGYYNKAIFAYEKLILKYPEKRFYFAGQIEAIKKLTNKQ